MADVRLPIVRDLKIEAFTGGTITSMSSFMQNCMVDKFASDTGERLVATQRPGINMVEDASTTVAKVKGRGIYYWDVTSADYFINDDTVYKSGYSTVVGTISGGTHKCSFHEVGGRLVIVDPENNEVWTITSLDVLAQVTDPQLPTTIAGSGATLDGYLFLMDDDGVIQHSDLDDATAWSATNFVEAEREADDGVSLAKHHDHIIAFGRSTIEFFYNASNSLGATISRRQDVFYNLGCPYEDGVWEDGDNIYFVGRTQRGDYGVYTIENFKLRMISSPELNSYLTTNYAQGSFFPLMAGFAARGHNFIAMTLHTISTGIFPYYTFVYDISTGLWGLWTTDMSELSTLDGFPVTGWTTSSSSRFGTGIMSNGDLITLRGDFGPVDIFDEQFYVENQDDYVVTDYIASFGSASGANIPVICRVGHTDNNSSKGKFGRTLELVMQRTTTPQTITLKWSDTDHVTFTSTRTLNTNTREKLSRLGRYHRRTYQLEYSGDEIIRPEALEYAVNQGST